MNFPWLKKKSHDEPSVYYLIICHFQRSKVNKTLHTILISCCISRIWISTLCNSYWLDRNYKYWYNRWPLWFQKVTNLFYNGVIWICRSMTLGGRYGQQTEKIRRQPRRISLTALSFWKESLETSLTLGARPSATLMWHYFLSIAGFMPMKQSATSI